MSPTSKPNTAIPGAPASEATPSVAEPAEPREPLPTRPDQGRPAAVSPTGSPDTARARSGAYLTTAQGLRLSDTDHSLKAGARSGPRPGPDRPYPGRGGVLPTS